MGFRREKTEDKIYTTFSRAKVNSIPREILPWEFIDSSSDQHFPVILHSACLIIPADATARPRN